MIIAVQTSISSSCWSARISSRRRSSDACDSADRSMADADADSRAAGPDDDDDNDEEDDDDDAVGSGSDNDR